MIASCTDSDPVAARRPVRRLPASVRAIASVFALRREDIFAGGTNVEIGDAALCPAFALIARVAHITFAIKLRRVDGPAVVISPCRIIGAVSTFWAWLRGHWIHPVTDN